MTLTTVNHRPLTPHHRATNTTKASRRARFAPDTAMRCVSPVARNWSVIVAETWEVSPRVRAGTSARWSAGSVSAACRSPLRTRSTATNHHGGSDSMSGRVRGRTRAATPSATSAADRRPENPTVAPTIIDAHSSTLSPLAWTVTACWRAHA
jgi:hypothetical protein